MKSENSRFQIKNSKNLEKSKPRLIEFDDQDSTTSRLGLYLFSAIVFITKKAMKMYPPNAASRKNNPWHSYRHKLRRSKRSFNSKQWRQGNFAYWRSFGI